MEVSVSEEHRSAFDAWANTPIAFVALTEGGARLARRMVEQFPRAEVHGRTGRVTEADTFFVDTAAHLRALFRAETPVVAVCASGIVVRALAPVLEDKMQEPAVVAMAESGLQVVPLLGGHQAEANALARALAECVGGNAAITTGSDDRFGVALDAPPPEYVLANPADHKAFAAALLAGETVAIRTENDEPIPHWLASTALPVVADASLEILITERPLMGHSRQLVYHPKRFALGVGCERDTQADELMRLVRDTLARANLAQGALAGVFSVDLKSDESCVHTLADSLGVAARFFTPARLERETPRLPNPSEIVFREVGCHGVCEAAALAAAGDHATLAVAKTKSRRATCAVARAPAPFDATERGVPRGKLWVVGIGPGQADMRSPQATAAIAGASHVVGYRLYVDLVAPLLSGKTVHAYALGEEAARVQHAIELAALGNEVALVCSGDAGIYAMASLVFEMLANRADTGWKAIDVEVVAGISALQVAAAKAGAPLGHDFCAISLSDLLTPRAVIEQRLHAAGAGDFVMAFYNPISKKRVATFERAMAIVREYRSEDTVVVVAKNLGRRDEALRVMALREVRAEDVDMLSLVLIGSSNTVAFARQGRAGAFTPRGYAMVAAGETTPSGVSSA